MLAVSSSLIGIGIVAQENEPLTLSVFDLSVWLSKVPGISYQIAGGGGGHSTKDPEADAARTQLCLSVAFTSQNHFSEDQKTLSYLASD